jgi:hypothetical protein
MPYNDVRPGTSPLTLFITFNIYVMNVLAFVIVCDFLVTNPFAIPGFDIIQHLQV